MSHELGHFLAISSTNEIKTMQFQKMVWNVAYCFIRIRSTITFNFHSRENTFV